MDSPTGLGICRLSDGLRKALLEDTSSDSCGELGDLKGCEPGSGEEGEPANLCSSSGFQPLSLSATAVQQLDTRQPRRASQPACSAHQAADQHPAAINVPWLHKQLLQRSLLSTPLLSHRSLLSTPLLSHPSTSIFAHPVTCTLSSLFPSSLNVPSFPAQSTTHHLPPFSNSHHHQQPAAQQARWDVTQLMRGAWTGGDGCAWQSWAS